MSNIKLKPCPFCGGKAKFKDIGARKTAISVGCTTCCASSRIILISAEYCANERAAKDWNRRADVPPKANWTRVTTVKQSRTELLSVADAKKRFLCRRIRLITARTAGREWV